MRSSHQPVRAHVLDPRLRRVPVVVDVVVVEDHRRRHRREQPADVRLRPRLAVQPRVLLEVGDGLARRHLGVAARADVLAHARRDLVGVDLVAEQHERVRPVVRVLPGTCGRRARAARRPRGPSGCSSLRSEYGGSCGAQTRHEPQAIRNGPLAPWVRTTLGGYGEPASGQTRSPSSRTSYGVVDAGSSPVQCDERVVVAVDAERALAAAEHLDLARRVGLDPDRRLVLPRVAQERAEDEPRHQPASARSARTASISAGRSPVPSTVSDAVTAASRRPSAARASR